MTEAASRLTWRITAPLHFRVWEGEYIVYHTLSGDTHLLGPAAACLLLKLQQTPADTAGLCNALAQQLNVLMDEAFILQTGDLLADLASLLLIERH